MIPKPVMRDSAKANGSFTAQLDTSAATIGTVVAPAPRPVNPGVIVEMCNQIEHMIQIQGSSQPGVPGDPSVVREVKSYFEAVN